MRFAFYCQRERSGTAPGEHPWMENRQQPRRLPALHLCRKPQELLFRSLETRGALLLIQISPAPSARAQKVAQNLLIRQGSGHGNATGDSAVSFTLCSLSTLAPPFHSTSVLGLSSSKAVLEVASLGQVIPQDTELSDNHVSEHEGKAIP